MKRLRPVKAALGRLSVGQQLYGAFGVLLLLTALLGGVGLVAMAQVDRQADALAGKWLRGVGHLAAARAAIVDAREHEVKHSRTDDSAYHAEYQEKIQAAAKEVAASLAAYRQGAVGDDEGKLLGDVDKGWAAYLKASQQVVALGRDHKQQDAADVSDGVAMTSYDELLGALNALNHYNFEGGKAAAVDVETLYQRARWSVVGLIVGALLLGLLLAVGITRRLLAQLGGEPSEAAAVARAVAGGDLTTRIVCKAGDTDSLMASLAAMQHGLAQAVLQVRKGSENVASASAQIAEGNQDLSGRTEQQASALQQTAATMEELGTTVRNNADNAQQANQLAQGAAGVAVTGGEVVGQVVQTMRGINDSSCRIAEIISVIDGIAFQTNILALNAAVEAARAGEQGRGFAVVAGEVRSLARRSAEAAREIKTLITDSVERVDRGSALVDRAGRTMEEIVGAIRRVTDIVGEISAASAEQSNGVGQVAQAVSQMDRATQQNAELVEQSAAAAGNLKRQSHELVEAVAVFRIGS